LLSVLGTVAEPLETVIVDGAAIGDSGSLVS
jgi:hypothetical protein